MAEFFDVARDTVRKDWKSRQGFPLGPPFDLAEVARWRIAEVERRAAKKLRPDGDDPELEGFEGFDSPNLERWRGTKADLAAIELLKAQREVIDRSAAHDGLGEVAAVLRLLGERLQQLYGPQAQQLLDEALESVETKIETIFGGVQDDLGGDETSDD